MRHNPNSQTLRNGPTHARYWDRSVSVSVRPLVGQSLSSPLFSPPNFFLVLFLYARFFEFGEILILITSRIRKTMSRISFVGFFFLFTFCLGFPLRQGPGYTHTHIQHTLTLTLYIHISHFFLFLLQPWTTFTART
ncbi:hypothetical protein DFH27DRAFT_250733 [Peziza echinospora]|nr:hypothetical protein DFH27DRAFT_250733 [Peziza echinospora]